MTDDVRLGEQDRTGATESPLDRLIDASADRVYAEPVRVADRVVIPAASIDYASAYGFAGTDPNAGRKAGRRVAIIEAGPDGVRVRPVVDLARVGLTVAAAAFAIWRAAKR
jgi:hypothetical protein